MSSRKLLLKFALQYPWRIFFNVLLSFSGALFNGVNTALLVPVLLQFVGQQINLKSAPPAIKAIIAPFDSIPEDYRLAVMLAAILLTIILKNLTGYVSALVSVSLRRTLMNDIREVGLRMLLEVDLDFYSKIKIGDIVRRLDGESFRATSAIITYVRGISISTTIIVFIGILIAISWQLTLVSTLLLAAVALVNQSFTRRAKYFGQVLTQKARAYSSTMLELLNGMRIIKAVGSEEREFTRLKTLLRDHEKAEFKSQMNSAAVGPISEVTGIFTLIIIIFVGRSFFSTRIDALSAVLLTYLVVLFRLLPFISQLNNIRNSLANTTASVEIVHDFLRTDNKPFMPKGSITYSGLQKGIQFERVTFSYPGQKDLVLKDIDLFLPRGTTLALVGGSGAGKSTLADLLARFYDPTDGRITIDGKDLREFELHSLRKVMAIVSQETFLFNDSVRNNISYARPEATEEEIVEAAKRANAYEFITRLPQGLDTEVGDRGVMLSGGQRQRLAIARGLLQDPDILILDEATSALDTVSERLVQEAIDELSRDRTVLVIAHRLSTVQKAHQIAVLDKGRVVEVGNHEELLKLDNYYARLYGMQFSDTPEDHNRKLYDEALIKTSYEARTYLNSMMGVLRILVDDIVDNSEERKELTEEAYDSAMRLFQRLETLESSAKQDMSTLT